MSLRRPPLIVFWTLSMALGFTPSALANSKYCKEILSQYEAITSEIADKDSNPNTLRRLLSQLDREMARCLNDGDGNGISDAVDASARAAQKAQKISVKDWEKRADKWLADREAVVKWSCAQIKKVEDALCGVEADPNDTPDFSAAKAMAKDMESIGVTRIGLILDRWSELSKHGKELKLESSSRYQKMFKKQGQLRKAWSKKIMAGARNPFTKFVVEYGKQMHKKMEVGCPVYDIPIPGKRGRPDCFRPSQCLIVEFKPEGNTTWVEQVKRYKKNLTQYYKKELKAWETQGKDYAFGGDNTFNNQAVMTAVKKQCYSNGKVRLVTKPEFYTRCEARFTCSEN